MQDGYRAVAVAPHVHTRFSDGKRRLAHVVAVLRAAGYTGVWMTDHADMEIHYPLWGARVGIRRHSLKESGFHRYLVALARAQAQHPDMVVIPGFEANPYYFWTGRPFSREVINWQWRRHMIVAGIEDERTFHALPMMGNRQAPYPPGFSDAGEAPFQRFAEAITAAGGLLFWAHPFQPEREHIFDHVYSMIRPYNDALLTVPNSQGTGVSRPDDSILRPGGIWDQALAAYVRGARPALPGVSFELDYHQGTFHPRATLHLWIPADLTDPAARKRACLDALRAGRYYATSAPPDALVLEECVLTAGDAAAAPGERLPAAGPLTLSYSIRSENPLQWVQILRDGAVVQTLTTPAGAWRDARASAQAAPAYYRLMAQDVSGHGLVCMPIFVQSP